jgi:hypothetical protein
MSYAHGKVYQAAHALRSQNLSVQERLHFAGQALLMLRVHVPKNPDVARRVDGLLERLTVRGSIQTTTAALDDASAEALVTEFLTLFEDLGRANPESPFGEGLIQATDVD